MADANVRFYAPIFEIIFYQQSIPVMQWYITQQIKKTTENYDIDKIPKMYQHDMITIQKTLYQNNMITMRMLYLASVMADAKNKVSK